MTKIALVIANLFLLIGVRLFFEGDVAVTQSVPESAYAGETFVIEVNIKKEDRDGFAKWQQELPEGFIATSIETEGATFSFKNQTVKLIWMAIPNKDDFTFSYEVKTDPTLNGEFELNGKFSYIENNERKDISTESKRISILTPSDSEINAIVEKTEQNPEEIAEPTEEENVSSEETVVDSGDEMESDQMEETQPTEGMSEGDPETVIEKSGIRIERKISYLDAGNYQVDLKIKKGAINSFGKIEEYLPPGFEASALENGKGRFSFDNRVMKILWMIMPQDETLELSYVLTSTTDELDDAIVHGVFSYLDQDQSKQIELEGTEFKNTFLSEEEEEEKEEEIVEKEESFVAEKTMEEPKAVEPEAKVEEELSMQTEPEEEKESIPTDEQLVEEITNIPSEENGINYKVQIAAGRKEVKPSYFEKVHSISEKVDIEFHESWFKYTLGLFDVYKEARDKRNEIWQANNKIDDAFVTAYNSGERISVQEALMISNQKWFK